MEVAMQSDIPTNRPGSYIPMQFGEKPGDVKAGRKENRAASARANPFKRVCQI